jgi:general secretion pathway protein E/type IV pilus assembly protein PilB
MSQAVSESDVVRLVNQLLVDAVNARASDVHVETDENDLTLRYRIDGVLQSQTVPPVIRESYSNVISRLKLLANLDITERRLPQDGRFVLKGQGGRDVDVRMSCIPTFHGEGIVMRILDSGSATMSIRGLGFEPELYEKVSNLLRLPHGLILATGPTGSGKSTTLYSLLTALNKPGKKIITVEDPVEYKLNGASQIQINEKVGLTFAAMLRRILRHDPDIVLVGEIRDAETLGIALQAAVTGHLVFSTLHTNDAAGAFIRFLSQDIEPFLVSTCVSAVIAQRLVRNLCPHCKQVYIPKEDELPPDFPMAMLSIDQALMKHLKQGAVGGKIYRSVGCPRCQNTGYKGRSGIYELLVTSQAVSDLIVRRATVHEIRQQAIQDGMRTMRTDGWRKVANGETTIEEVMRVTAPDTLG